MADHSDTGHRFQISLRTFLLASCATGLGMGILGHLCLRYPDVFLGLLALLSTILPFLLAIGTILWVGWRSQRRRWGLIVWGCWLLVMPLIGLGVLFVARQRIGSSPSNLQFQSTQQLIQQQLPKRIDEPWAWRELERRLTAGTLPQEDVDEAVKQLVLHMTTTKPNGWDQPLHWQHDFLKAATQAGKVSEPVLLKLCEAFYGPKPVIQPLPQLRENKDGLQIELRWGNHWSNSNLDVELLWQVNRVLLDGKPFNVRENSKTSTEWGGYYTGRLPAGNHELTLEVEAAYIDQSKLVGLSARRLSKSLWPQARKRWTQTVSAPLRVYPSDAQIVSLTTDVGSSPGPTGGVQVERLVAQPDRDGKTQIVLKASFSEVLSAPLSYDVAVSINGQQTKLGAMWIVRSGNRSSQGGSHLSGRVDALDLSITQADLILTPNPVHVEQHSEVTEIWGKATVLRNIPLERLDLEKNQGVPRP